MAGPLPAPDPAPHSTSTLLLQASNLLPLSPSNQIQEHPFPLLLRPSDPAVRWSDQSGPSSDPLLQPPVPAPPPADLLFLLPIASDPPPFPPASVGLDPDLPSSSSDPPASAPFSSFAASQAPPALQRPESSLPALPSPGFAHDSTPSVRSNASAATSSSAAPPLPSSAPPPPLSAAPPPFPPAAPSTLYQSRASPQHSADPLIPQASQHLAAPQPPPASTHHPPPHVPSTAPPPARSSAHLPQQKLSYAQVASGPRGTGFVKAHACEVEAFARLPRSGINIINGSREGMPSFSFAHSDFPKIANVYANALVMKFLGGRPSLEMSHKEISNWGIENPFSIGPLSSRAFLLRFQNENDLLKVLTRPSQSLITFPYKIFRWHTQCHIKDDSCMAPVWVSLPNIELHCFLPEFLEAVANRIGRFLCLDKATATLARPSSARMCVEIDLRKPPPQFIWVGLFDGFKQPVVYEKLPKFCTQCHLRGHSTVHCSKFSMDTPQNQLAGRHSAVQNSAAPVHRNATVQSSVISQDNIPLGPPDPFPQLGAVPPQPSAPPRQHITTSAAPHAPSPSSVEPSSGHHPPGRPNFQPFFPQSAPESAPSSSTATNPSISPILANPLPPSVGIAAAGPVSTAVASSSSLEPPSAVQPQPLAQSQCPPPQSSSPLPSKKLSPSPRHKFPAIRLMPHPRSSPVRSNAAEAPPAAAPPLHQSQPQHPPPPSSKNRSKHKKSVSFMPKQSNIQANQVVWDVVNRQIEQFNKAHFSSNERDPEYSHAYKEPPDPSFFSHFESDSEASVEAHSPTGSHSAIAHEEGSSFPQSYASEGEELNVEPINLQGHISDDAFYQRPKSSKRNKRHPDGPLKVKLRARKGSSSIHR